MSQPVSDETNLDTQYRRPFGEVGQRIGAEMARDHLPENLWTIAQLNPQPTDHILEIGFGPGVAVRELLKHVTAGLVAGVDFSETMVAAARQRNAGAIAAHRADLRYGEAIALPFATASFGKAFAIHSLYFWGDPCIALAELYRVLKPGGLLVITMLPKERWGANPAGSDLEYGTPECTPYFGTELEQLLRDTGFRNTRIAADPTTTATERKSNYSVLATK